jgi:hypothetical protein
MILFVASGLVQAAVSVPLILGLIPPNGLYGFRLRKTMEHPEIWYPVNKYGGERLLLASLLLILAAVAYTLIPGITFEVYSFAVLITWVIGATIAVVNSFRYINTLKMEESPVVSKFPD